MESNSTIDTIYFNGSRGYWAGVVYRNIQAVDILQGADYGST